jgi:hypothetical protein
MEPVDELNDNSLSSFSEDDRSAKKGDKDNFYGLNEMIQK